MRKIISYPFLRLIWCFFAVANLIQVRLLYVMTISVLVSHKENIGFLSQMSISDSVLIKWCFKWFIFPTEIQLYYIRYTISIQLVFGQTAAGKHSLSRRPLIYTMYCIYASPLETSLIARSVGPPGAYRTQVGHMLAPWTLLSGIPMISTIYGVLACILT